MLTKKIIIIFCFLSIPGTTFNLQAQQGWFQLGFDTNVCLHSTYFINNNTGWVVGHWPGIICKTTNGGLNWVEQWQDYTYALLSVTFVNNNFGCAVGPNGLILTTSNSGNTWVRRFG